MFNVQMLVSFGVHCKEMNVMYVYTHQGHTEKAVKDKAKMILNRLKHNNLV